MAVRANLRAATDRYPRIDHRARAHIGTDIDEARHQDHVFIDETATTHERAGNGAEPRFAIARFIPIGEFQRHFIEPGRTRIEFAGAVDQLVIVQAEGQQNCLLHPLIHHPCAIFFLSDAQRALVELRDSLIHRVAHFTFGGEVDISAIFPRSFDNGLNGHANLLNAWRLIAEYAVLTITKR